jgi:hypothetical protein
LGAEIECPVCGRRVSVRGPPPEGFQDPWAGSTDSCISPHWSRAMPEGETAAQPLAHGGSRSVEEYCPGASGIVAPVNGQLNCKD